MRPQNRVVSFIHPYVLALSLSLLKIIMETAALKSLVRDPDYYTKAFHAYAKKTKKFEVLEEWGNNTFPGLVGDTLAATLPADTDIKMLGIGSGSGEIDTKMAAHLKSRFKSVRNVVLEPATEQVEMYRSLVGSKSEEFRDIEFDLRQLGIDEYRAQEGDQPSKYHLISAFHSIYYAQDHKETIRYLYDCLEEGGVLLITVLAVDGGLWRIWDRFTIFQDGVTRHICTTHLREIFSSLAIPFEESRQSANLDVTSCFQEGSEDGELIIDFLTHTVDLRGTAPPVLYQKVVDFLRSDQCSTQLKDGTVLMNNDWDAFIAQKPLSK